MKRIISTLGMAACVLASYAADSQYDYPYLAFQAKDASSVYVAVGQLSMTVADGQLIIVNADGESTLTVGDLDKMYFSTTFSAISKPGIDVVDGGAVSVYGLDGTLRGEYPSAAEACRSLDKGLYIIRSTNSTEKIVVR